MKLSTRPNIAIKYDRSGEFFCATHATGSKTFKGAWLVSNMAITEHCSSRVDVSDPAVKELLSLAALRVLMRLKSDGYLNADE